MTTQKPKSKKKLIFITIAAVIVIGSGAFAALFLYRMDQVTQMTFEEMLAFVTKDDPNVVIAVGTVQNGETTITVYGDNMTVLPNTDQQFEIGSVTKTFTTALLSKAIDEGKAALTDSIDQYIDLPEKDYYPSLARLVTHTSGYKGNYFDRQMVSNFFGGAGGNLLFRISTQTIDQKIASTNLEDKEYPFAYSNFGLSVVGSALEGIYGGDYKAIMNEYIRSELKLANTKISEGTGNLSGYWKWNPDDGYLPAGAILSTIGDMMQYVSLHMTEELPYLSLGHEKIAEINGTTEQYAKLGIRLDSAGIGWMIDDLNHVIWHNGGTSKFNSYVGFDKEKQVGVVILSNLSPNARIPATIMGSKLITTLQGEDSQ